MIYVVYFSNAGTPKTGLSPTLTTYKKVSDGSDVASPPAVSAIGGGLYKFTATPAEALAVVVDGGASLAAADRYKVLQLTPHDGDLDAQVSTRAAESGGNLAAVKAKTDNLPADPAGQNAVDAAVSAAVAPLAVEGNVQGHLTAALNTYDPPTQAEMEAGLAGLAQEANVQAHAQAGAAAALVAYDPPTRAEATSDKDAIVAQVDANEAKLDTLDTAVSAIKVKTDNLPAAPASEATLTAVKVQTDNLPPDPADQSGVEAAVAAAINSIKGTDEDDLKIISDQIDGIAGGLGGGVTPEEIWTYAGRTLTAGPKDAEIDAIKAKTDGLPGDPASQAAVLAAIAGLGDLTVGELLAGDLSDHLSFPANSLADLLRKVFWTLCNRLVINDATGEFTAYKSDGVTPAVTGAIAADGATTERRAPAWP